MESQWGDKMKIEKINENQIRCTLTRADLEKRQIKLSELAYGSEKARALFREMMLQAFQEFGFEVHNIPLMIEAVPAGADQLVLLVTKVQDPEELDARFSHFSPDTGRMEENGPSLTDVLSGADDVLNLLKKFSQARSGGHQSTDSSMAGGERSDGAASQGGASAERAKSPAENEEIRPEEKDAREGNSARSSSSGSRNAGHAGNTGASAGKTGKRDRSGSANEGQAGAAPRPGQTGPGFSTPQNPNSMTEEEIYQYTRFYLFRDLESVVSAARRIGEDYKGENTLYKNPDDGAFYLLVRKQDTEPEQFNRICNLLSEYAMPMDYTTGMDEFFREHMKVIVDNFALQRLRVI